MYIYNSSDIYLRLQEAQLILQTIRMSEQLRRVRKFSTTTGKDLHKLKLYSLDRRHERYKIIYILKIIKHMVPNDCGKNKNQKTSEAWNRVWWCAYAVGRSGWTNKPWVELCLIVNTVTQLWLSQRHQDLPSYTRNRCSVQYVLLLVSLPTPRGWGDTTRPVLLIGAKQSGVPD